MCRSGPWPRRQSRPWAAPTGKRRIHRSYPMSRKLTTPAAVAASLVALMVAAPAGAADYVQAAGSTLAFATKYDRSEEHTSELQSLMRISYAVFCLKKKKRRPTNNYHKNTTIYIKDTT